MADESWKANIVESDEDLRDILRRTSRIAVLGIKTEQQSQKPAFFVPEYLARAGFDVIPVPTYYPEIDRILGRKAYRLLAEIPGHVDMVNVFRRAEDIPAHLEDILRKRPSFVWFQSGIRNDKAAEFLAREGIKVVQSRCIMVEHRALC